MKITTGTRFTQKASRGWRDEDSNRHRHTYSLLVEVTGTTDQGFTWKTVELLEESDAPTEGRFVPNSGTIAWFGFEASVNRGDSVLAS